MLTTNFFSYTPAFLLSCLFLSTSVIAADKDQNLNEISTFSHEEKITPELSAQQETQLVGHSIKMPSSLHLYEHAFEKGNSLPHKSISASYRKLSKKDPGDLYKQGINLCTSKEYEQAFLKFKKVSYINSDGNALYYMGLCQKNLNNLPLATNYFLLSAYMSKIKAEKYNPYAVRALGETHLGLKDIDSLSVHYPNTLHELIDYAYPLAIQGNTRAMHTLGQCYGKQFHAGYQKFETLSKDPSNFEPAKKTALLDELSDLYEASFRWYLLASQSVSPNQNLAKTFVSIEEIFTCFTRQLIAPTFSLLTETIDPYKSTHSLHRKFLKEFKNKFLKNDETVENFNVYLIQYYKNADYEGYLSNSERDIKKNIFQYHLRQLKRNSNTNDLKEECIALHIGNFWPLLLNNVFHYVDSPFDQELIVKIIDKLSKLTKMSTAEKSLLNAIYYFAGVKSLSVQKLPEIDPQAALDLYILEKESNPSFTELSFHEHSDPLNLAYSLKGVLIYNAGNRQEAQKWLEKSATNEVSAEKLHRIYIANNDDKSLHNLVNIGLEKNPNSGFFWNLASYFYYTTDDRIEIGGFHPKTNSAAHQTTLNYFANAHRFLDNKQKKQFVQNLFNKSPRYIGLQIYEFFESIFPEHSTTKALIFLDSIKNKPLTDPAILQTIDTILYSGKYEVEIFHERVAEILFKQMQSGILKKKEYFALKDKIQLPASIAVFLEGVEYMVGATNELDLSETEKQLHAYECFKSLTSPNAYHNRASLHLIENFPDGLTLEEKRHKAVELLEIAALLGSPNSTKVLNLVLDTIREAELLKEEERLEIPIQKAEQEETQQSFEVIQETLPSISLSNKARLLSPFAKPVKENRKSLHKRLEKIKRLRQQIKLELDETVINKNEPVTFSCLSEEVEKDFQNLLSNENKKAQELIQEIITHKWKASGTGKPEILRHKKGVTLISRRLNHEDRLVYEYSREGIKIHCCKGHYTNLN